MKEEPELTSPSPSWCAFCFFPTPTDASATGNPPKVVHISWQEFCLNPPEDCVIETYHDDDEENYYIENIKRIRTKVGVSYLRASGQRGCIGCDGLWRFIIDSGRQDVMPDHDIKLTWIFDMNFPVSQQFCLQLPLKAANGKVGGMDVYAKLLCTEGENAACAHPFAAVAPPTEASRSTGSIESLDLLQEWLRECEEKHTECHGALVSLPDRVLQLSTDATGDVTVKLIDGRLLSAPYVCLSHRWGPSTLRCRTTKDTLDQHRIDIPCGHLPKTFREAITVTLRLGVRYIWIDSLCIIQDDQDDWRAQSTRMCSIYAGARLTIAAAASRDSDQGLFSMVPYTTLGGAVGKAPRYLIYEMVSHQDSESTLLDRGWVYQERLLSPRTAYFSGSEVRFECVRNNRCDAGRCGDSRKHWRVAFNRELKRRHGHALATKDGDYAGRYWRDIVVEYSKLELSFATDRLPALAGVSEQYSTAHGDRLGRYVAGLWEDRLLKDLAWSPVTPGTPGGYFGLAKRTDAYRGPSWSWASIQGGARWRVDKDMVTDDGLSLVSCHVEPDGDSPFGGVTHAELTVTGLVAEGTLRNQSWPPELVSSLWAWRRHTGESRWGPPPSGLNLEDQTFRSTLDERHFFDPEGMPGMPFFSDHLIDALGPEHIPAGSMLYALRVERGMLFASYNDEAGERGGTALVLQPVEHRGRTKYKRIGLLHSPRHDAGFRPIESAGRMRTITLI